MCLPNLSFVSQNNTCLSEWKNVKGLFLAKWSSAASTTSSVVWSKSAHCHPEFADLTAGDENSAEGDSGGDVKPAQAR